MNGDVQSKCQGGYPQVPGILVQTSDGCPEESFQLAEKTLHNAIRPRIIVGCGDMFDLQALGQVIEYG